ncbi:MAG: GIY-YIG nuclease family protein [Gammaproteobacteria bacterium]|nr:GIY-YIG nuclease family protein [Gammaproteobacteria bacterium]
MRLNDKPYYVYILECRDGRLYTGITTDLQRRLSEHNTGKKAARFTRANPPKMLIAARQVAGRSAALQLEAGLKRCTREKKLRWVEENPVSLQESMQSVRD